MNTFGPGRVERSRSKIVVGILTVGIFMSALLFPAAAQQQPGAADLQGFAQSLLAQMSGEMVRLRTYLIFYDQINRVHIATGQMKASEADTKLQQKSQELLQTSYVEPELDRLINEHRREVDAYFAKIEQGISTTRRWPKGAQASEYKARAKSELQSVRREYEARMTQMLDPLQALERATTVLGWTMGHATPPASINVFAGQQARIAAAVQNPLLQSLLNAAAMA